MSDNLSFLYVYLTDACNLKCTHCWQSAPLQGLGNYSRLKFEECKNFLKAAIDLGLKNITFSGGEPLLNRDIHNFANYFFEHSIRMSMETNGILINRPHIIETIKNCNIYCAVSLDGINPETHNLQRGDKDAFGRTLKGIETLEQNGIEYQLIISVSKLNYHELVPLADYIKKNFKSCNSLKINIVNSIGRGKDMDDKELLFKAEELPEITEQVADLVGNYPFKILLHIDPIFFSFKNLMLNYSCGGSCGYQNGLSILANGTISICSLGKQIDKYTFGHVSSVDLKQLWTNTPVLTDIRENPHTKLKGICSNCIFRKQCLGGCRAEALGAYRDIYAPHPRCQTFYDSGKLPASKLISPKRKNLEWVEISG